MSSPIVRLSAARSLAPSLAADLAVLLHTLVKVGLPVRERPASARR